MKRYVEDSYYELTFSEYKWGTEVEVSEEFVERFERAHDAWVGVQRELGALLTAQRTPPAPTAPTAEEIARREQREEWIAEALAARK